MEFRETLLAAQRNQQQKSSDNVYYKARFDPPKKEQKSKDRLSENIQKFLAKKDEEEKKKKLEAQRKREELLAMRDPKALRKIQKTLKVIKSANKSVLADAIDRDNTAYTREGQDQPDQDDYGYESQEAAALYAKMMQKYSKIPDEPKFPTSNSTVKKDLKGTMERVKHALQHEDDPVPHKRKRRKENGEREPSPPPKAEQEKRKDERKDEKHEKQKQRRPMPPPIDFNQLLKLAEQKKSEPVDIAAVKRQAHAEAEPERPMTKKQRREYEEEQARLRRRQQRLDEERGAGGGAGKKSQREERPAEKERKPESGGFGRIPKLNDKVNGSYRNDSPKPKAYDKEREKLDKDRERLERDRERYEKEREKHDREREREKLDRDREKLEKDRERYEKEREKHDIDRAKFDKEKAEKLQREKERLMLEKAEREKERAARERLEKLKAERERIDREMERLSRDKERLEKSKQQLESKSVDKSRVLDKPKQSSVRADDKKSIDLKSQNTYRIDRNCNERKPVANKDIRLTNGHSSQVRPVPKSAPQKSSLDVKKSLDGSPKVNGHRPDIGKRLPDKGVISKRPDHRKPQAGPSKLTLSNSFDFDKHVKSLKNTVVNKKPSIEDRKKPKRRLESDSEYDSEMDDFIDDGDETLDYSRHIKEIFGYDKSKYRNMDDDDDPAMESSFVQQQREEYISKKHGILEDLEDMRLEAMEKKMKGKKKRRLSDEY